MGARGSRAPCLSLCLGFPQGWSRRGPRRIWGAPRSPARVSPGGPGTGSWRVPRRPQPAHKLGGSAHVAGPARGFRFCRPPTSSTRDSRQRRLLSPLSLPPKCSEGRVANTVVGPRRGGGGGPVGGPRRVHHSLSAPEPATVFILMEPLPAQPHLSPQGCL